MHPNILAKRQLDALNAVTDAMTLLSERYGISPPALVQQRDPQIGQMLRWEAVAQFMQSLCLVPQPEPGIALDDLLAIEGLSKTSIAKIKQTFGPAEGEPNEE